MTIIHVPAPKQLRAVRQYITARARRWQVPEAGQRAANRRATAVMAAGRSASRALVEATHTLRQHVPVPP